MPKLNLFLKQRCLVQSELSPMGDRSLVHSAPLYSQAMGLTVPELMAQRVDSIQIMTDHKGDR